jgi:hypothetical protein
MKSMNHNIKMVAIVALGLMFSVVAFGKKPAPMYVPSVKGVIEQVKDQVSYPDFKITKEDRGDIQVTFLLTDDGGVQVESITAPSEKMENYVREQLAKVSMKDVIHPYNQLYKMTLKFSQAG